MRQDGQKLGGLLAAPVARCFSVTLCFSDCHTSKEELCRGVKPSPPTLVYW